MPFSPVLPRNLGPFLGSTNYFLIASENSGFLQLNSGGFLQDVYYDVGNVGSLIVGIDPQLHAGTALGCFFGTEYRSFVAGNSGGFFSIYTSGVDAEILNLFSDDNMYIGPYYDPAGTNSGTNVIYRAGYANEGDGTWFASRHAEFSWNTQFADVDTGLGACFWMQGVNLDVTVPVLHVQARATATIVQRLVSEATNDNPIEEVVQNRVATTAAAITTLHTFTIPASTTYAIVATVTARRTGGAAGTAEDGARYVIYGTYKNVAGTATIIGSLTTMYDESVVTYAADLSVTGATVICRVTGVVNTNITWHMTARTYYVGS